MTARPIAPMTASSGRHYRKETSLGAIVVVAGDLAEIEPEHVAAQFDAAIVDLMLSGTSTLGFASLLRESGLPFIFASGHSEVDELKAAFPEIRLVSKPFSGEDLVEAVAAACGRGPLA
ncbi:MAG: response regulator [Mesorhizobium sp.]|nr:MAG: response regulator [Mesorhizobium sp.]